MDTSIRILFLLLGVFYVRSEIINQLREDELLELKHPDLRLSTTCMVQEQGYNVEEHTVQTRDGYLLTMHRIPYGKHNANQTNQLVAFLMHGVLSSSADWVNMGSERSLAYILADAGYDVWLGNARGNKWSRNHVRYNPDVDGIFWDFSWHEIGTIDLPEMIDYILKATGQKSLFYIGHSQGTTTFFVMASEKPEYNDKIRLMVALAPVAYMDGIPNKFFRFISPLLHFGHLLVPLLGKNEFLPDMTRLLDNIGQKVCELSVINEVCSSILFMICGWDSEQLDRNIVPVILANTPAGASTKQFLHYAQGVVSGKFRQYDYGRKGNIGKYGSRRPPEYALENIKAPVWIAYSQNDLMAAPTNVERLAYVLPNVTDKFLVPYKKFNNLDFLFAKQVKQLVYDGVLEIMKRF